jgi:hypothetical protein
MMRELVIARMKELVDGEDDFVDSHGANHVFAEFDSKSDEFLLTILEDLIWLNG